MNSGRGLLRAAPRSLLDQTAGVIANRLSGLFISLFGVVLYLVIIPYDTEQVSGGWVEPDTVPNFAAVVLIIAGAIHAFIPTGSTTVDGGGALRVGVLLVLAATAILAIGEFGFLFVSPLYVLIQMLLIGERRIAWYLVGVIIVPLVIWFTTTQLLGRALP
jgi:putative tricarboxylic transport membrane protein